MIKRGLIVLLSVVALVSLSFSVSAGPAANVTSPFLYNLNSIGVLYESGSMSETTSPYWWLNSGAKLNISNGTGKTVQNELASNDKWRLIYASSNPLDTDNGYHPQNIFRLITRSKWQNFQQINYFKINKDELSASPNRAEHNGLLLMSRYKDGNTLYYTGVRVDGYAVIKKKLNGSYKTLAYKRVFPGTYNRNSNPNLLPKNTWIGLKSEVKTLNNGRVNIKLYMDNGRTGTWTLIAEATDSSSPILTEGYAGIRTDFMDVEFDDYKNTNI